MARRSDSGYRWRDAHGEIVVSDGAHTPIPSEIRPGRSTRVPAVVIAPSVPGSYVLELDLVHEGVRWFGGEHRMHIEVRPVQSSRGSALD